ncbi:MAG: MBL fold metallo-hydrolase [Gemmatimonadetes bacterium]|nr:MBL fold metallo-hydrolase [Gemmatimonadota bacterium]
MHPHVRSTTVGRFRLHAIQAGGQRLDGGAMFGVVPKPLWERRVSADERNRIQLGMRCLLVEHDDGLVLVDTGLGNKEGAKFHDIYGIENAGGGGRTWLESSLASLGFGVDDVRWVVNTHLHFDHAGGNTWVDDAGSVRATFPRARYVVQRGEHAFATATNERTAASYFPHNWEPILAGGQFDLLDGEQDVVPGIRVIASGGHVPYHQSVLVDGGGGEVACFLGDVCPTASHLPLPWIMGYDVEPLVTLESKRRLLARAVAERWLLIFEHDAAHAWGYARHDGKSYQLDEFTADEVTDVALGNS